VKYKILPDLLNDSKTNQPKFFLSEHCNILNNFRDDIFQT
jgi:hypothetical protein